MKRTVLSRRDFIKVSALSATGLVLAACTPAATEAPPEAPGAELIQLETTDFQGGQLNYDTAFEELIARFREDHPNVEISRRGMGFEEYTNAVQPIIASGDLPDIMGLYQGPDLFSAIDADLLVSLQPALDADPAWQDRIRKAITGFDDIQGPNGDIYAAPLDVILIVMGIWHEQLAAKGLDIGTTIDEFLAAARTLAAEGSYFTANTDHVASLLLLIQQQTGSIDLVRQAENGEVSWETDELAKAWQTWESLIRIEDGIVPPEAASITDAQSPFYAGEYWGNWYQGSWLAGQWEETFPDAIAEGKVGIANLPTVDASSNANIWSGGPGQTLSVADNEHQDAAIEFLKFLSTEDASKIMLKNNIQAAGAIDNPTQYTDGVALGLFLDGFDNADAVVGFNILNSTVFDKVHEIGGGLVLGTKTVEEGLAELNEASGFTG